MRRGEIIELGKHMAKEYFRICLEAINGDFGILEDDVQILGFKEDIEHDNYIIIFMLPRLDSYRCEILYDINTGAVKSNMFKVIDL